MRVGKWLPAGIISCILLCFTSLSSAAPDFGGDCIITGIKTGDAPLHLDVLHNKGAVYMVWSVSLLMGEPVVDGRGMVVIPDQKTYEARYKDKTFQIPSRIIKKITVMDAEIKAHLGANLFMDINLGAMADVYFGGIHSAKGLPPADKEKYLSYNVPGSPQWDQWLYRDNQGFSQQFLPEKQAKQRMQQGIQMIPLGTSARVDFNFNPIIQWIENQKAPKAKKADPFKKFAKMEAPAAEADLKKADADIRAFIINACGQYYIRVEEGRRGFHLTAEHLGETREERIKREKKEKAYREKRRERVRQAKQTMENELPRLQREFKEKRAAIRPDCRAYIMKKYGLSLPVAKLEQLLNLNFTATDRFKAVYYIPFDGNLNN
ncbi:MAG: hypothetical protein HUN04_20480 [Desulfobacter sp.]|nr:MAG: hypothetical protein HUN04_20480 [Desulfobacter sp.]